MIDLRHATVEDTIAEVRGAALVVADPPWHYNSGLEGAASNHYETTRIGPILDVLNASYDAAADHARLVIWTTGPYLAVLCAGMAPSRWRYVTAGAWWKSGKYGIGHHWLSQVEPVVVYVKGSPLIARREELHNGFAAAPGVHSAKPAAWMRQWLRRWTAPGDLVLDLYAGTAPLAHACAAEGRDYIGCEADHERWTEASKGLAHVTGDHGRQPALFGKVGT